MIRTESETVPTVVPIIFHHLDRMQLASRDIGNTGESVLNIDLPPTVREEATLINRSAPGERGVLQSLTIDPGELNVDSRRGAAQVKAQTGRPHLSFAQRQAHRVRKKALFDTKTMENS